MNIKVLIKDIKGQDDIIIYTEKKMSRLERYMSQIKDVKVELTQEKTKSRQQFYTAQATLNVNGFIIRGEQKSDSLKAAVDAVTDIMERQIARFKKKYEVIRGKSPASIRMPATATSEANSEKEEIPHLVKTKRFIVKPMTVEQAIDQMEYIGHDFFIFLNAEDNSVNMVYRRKDSRYGLIIPEFA